MSLHVDLLANCCLLHRNHWHICGLLVMNHGLAFQGPKRFQLFDKRSLYSTMCRLQDAFKIIEKSINFF